MDKGKSFTLALLITLTISFNFYLFNYHQENHREEVFVERVIDGDTIVLEGGQHARLLNINTPEKGEVGYEEAKSYLSNLENRAIEIEGNSLDKYNRRLIKVFSPDYTNLRMVELGLAKKFLVEESDLEEFNQAEISAVQNSMGLWKKSKYFGCFQIEVLPEEEIVQIEILCSEVDLIDFTVRDESRKKYKFVKSFLSNVNLHTKKGLENSTDLFWGLGTNVWNNDRDTFYLFDPQNNLAHHISYGY